MDANNPKPKSSKLFDAPITATIMDLPMVIIVAILSRLSIKPIFRCKTVCKLWYRLLTSDPLFLNMYHTKFPCILLSDGHSCLSLIELKANDDYYSRSRYSYRPTELSPKFHLPPLKLKMHLIGSCNGFICLLNGSMYNENHSVYINNPLLGEYFKLKLPEWEKRVRRVGYAFCFSKASGQYKILRLVVRKFKGHPEVSELEVYTLGIDEKWRNVGQVPCPVWDHIWRRFYKAYVNGALHWMDQRKTDSIYSFDIGTEKLKSLPPPPGLKTPSWHSTLAELENCLCLTNHIHTHCVDIWRMKEYGVSESWTKDRILVDSIPPGMDKYNFEAILIWKDEEILIQSGGRLASYNPKEKMFKQVNIWGHGTATRYIPSFHSLKSVMGDNFQVSYVYSKPQII